MKSRTIALEFQPNLLQAPIPQEQAYKEACASDNATINHWEKTWLANIKANKAKYGSFGKNSAGILWGKGECQPAIIAGSGPSLKYTAAKLKDRPRNMLLISCLHNFHYLEDCDAKVDYYVTLDAGPITIKEVTEGGTKDPKAYWDMTKNRTLIAFIGTDPELLEKWQGKVLFYSAPIPDENLMKKIKEIENFQVYIESGGCVLGTSLFFAKGILGCQTTIFVGSDFSFSTEPKTRFHSWDSSYDANLGLTIKTVDIFGNAVKTWRSYYNFAQWFNVVAQRVPGIYINASEGGILGAYREGNIIAIKQMWYDDMIDLFRLHKHKMEFCKDPTIDKPLAIYI